MEKVIVRKGAVLTVVGFVLLGMMFFWSTQLRASEEVSEIDILLVAQKVVTKVLELQASSERGGFGENVVKEDILATYIPQIMALEKKKDSSLSDLEAERRAYGRIRRVLTTMADSEGNQDGAMDFKELEFLNNEAIRRNQGMIILRRLMLEKNYWFEAGPVEKHDTYVRTNQ